MQYEKVNENVFAIVDGTTRGNVAAFVLPTKVVMIDSGMNLPIIREFRKKVEEVSGKKVEMLILTHFHG
ncbi:MAG: MBL fold metallo-hydrolase, partial [Promethearchaeota archaeon]